MKLSIQQCPSSLCTTCTDLLEECDLPTADLPKGTNTSQNDRNTLIFFVARMMHGGQQSHGTDGPDPDDSNAVDSNRRHQDTKIVEEEGDDIVGMVGLEVVTCSNTTPGNVDDSNTALLRSLAVARHFRNRGIASQLVVHAETYARHMLHIQQLYLLTTKADEYFVKKHNYSIVDRKDVPKSIRSTSQFSTLCPCTAIVLTKWFVK